MSPNIPFATLYTAENAHCAALGAYPHRLADMLQNQFSYVIV